MLNFFYNFIENLPQYLLSLPIVLIALSFHELAHGFIAMKLGDNTARDLGRLTMNPLKHIDVIGFICMVFFHFGWAKPVPIQTRNFKNPRRDMALTGLAGPVSNVILALVSALILRLAILIMNLTMYDELLSMEISIYSGQAFSASAPFLIMSLIVYMCYIGIILNLSLALFNLIPIPPLDGSRIFYVFLPTKLYFGVMKYERYISIVMLILLWTGIISLPLSYAVGWITNGLLFITGSPLGSEAYIDLVAIYKFVVSGIL